MAMRAPPADDLIVKKRLRTQTSTTKKEDTPLKKLAKSYATFCAAAEAGDQALAATCYQQFVRDLSAFQFQISRGTTAAAVNSQEKEDYEQLQTQLVASIESTKVEIENLKKELEVARKERSNKEEYEKLRKECMRHASCAASKAAVKELVADIETLENEGQKTGEELEERKGKIAQLLQMLDRLCMHD